MKILISMIVLIFIATNLTFGEELTADQIIQKINDQINVEQSKGIAKMTIITSSGQERTFVYETYSKNRGEKNLIRYIEPRRVKGQAILMLNNSDDIWTYFPRTQRVRKLATHAKKQKMEGSDFSYEDMGAGDTFVEDYTAKKLQGEEKEGFDCYKLELVRKEGSDSGYSRLIIWARKEDFVPVVIDYYEDDDPNVLEKELVQSDFTVLQGIPTAMKMVMYNKQDATKTEMVLVEVDYNVELTDDMFTERELKK